VTILILIPIQRKIDKKILEVKIQTISIIEKQINRKISYSSISPSLFMYMEFRDLAIIDNNKELINIKRIRVHYNLRELLFGNIIESIKEIKIVKSNFIFDYLEDKDIIDYFNNLTLEGSSDLKLPDIKIIGKNLKIKLSNSSEVIELSKVFFTLNHKDNKTRINSRGLIKSSLSRSKFLSGKANFSISGSVTDNLEFSNSLFVFKSIENNYFKSNNISLQGSYKSGIIDLQKVKDSRPLDIRLSYSTIDKTLELIFNSENFVPLDYFDPKNIDTTILQWMGTSISGSGQLLYLYEPSQLNYSADIIAISNNKLIPTQVEIKSTLEGDKNKINFPYLKVNNKDGSLLFTGSLNYENFLPSGNLLLNYNHDLSNINAKLKIKENGNNLDISGPKIIINNVDLNNFQTSINFYKKDLDFKTSFNFDDDEYNTDKNISIDGNMQFTPDFFLNLSIDAINTPIISILKIIPLQMDQYISFIPDLNLNTNMFLSTDLKQFSFSGSQINLNSEINDDKISFSVFGNNESIEISKISANKGDKKLTGSIRTQLSKRSLESRIELLFEEIPYNLNVSYYPDRGIFIDGSYNLNGSLYKTGNISEFKFIVKDLPIPGNENTIKISLDSSGYFNNMNNWEANINQFDVLNIPGTIDGSNLNFVGRISEKNIFIPNINYSDTLSTLTGSAFFEHNFFKTTNIIGNFNLNSLSEEKYEGTITLKDDEIVLKTDFLNAPLDRFRNLPVSGFMNGSITLNGVLPNPDISMSLQLEKGEFNSSPLEIETSVNLNKEKLQLSYFRLKYMDQLIQKGNGEYNLSNGLFFITADYFGLFQEKNIKSLIEIEGEIDLKSQKSTLSEILTSNFKSKFSFTNINVNEKAIDSWDFNISSNDNSTSFEGGPGNSFSGLFDKSGIFNITSKTGLPLRGNAKGRINNSIIDLEIQNLEVDLPVLNLIPYGGFLEFTDGTAYGSLEISGQLNDPLFKGKLHAVNAMGNVFMVPENISPFETDIIFDGRTINVGPEILNVNNNSINVGIDLIINRWIPTTFTLNINTVDLDQVHIVYDIPSVGLGVDGYINGNFSISMDDYGLYINSDLTADDCIINLGVVGESTDSSSKPIFINMNFTTGRKVQFIWPSNTIPILNATADTEQSINFTMDKLSSTYSLTGEVNIKYGSIYYFQKSFYLSEGSIVFDENENRFDPYLDFIAQIKEVDTQGEIVNISLIQDNMPVSRFSPRFESDPPLSDVEIFSILGSGVFTQIGDEQIDLTSALLLTGDLLAQFAIIRNFENKVKDIFNLDLFSIRTQMIQNILIDRLSDENSADPEAYLDSFGRFLDNTTLYLGKYIGDDIFLQALFQINNQILFDAEQLNATNSLLVESTLSLEWQTPLFLLGFSVKPDFIDPASSIQNTSLELSWGYSY
jgi:translocation and assembly module TamB